MLPWATVTVPLLGDISVSGTDGDGVLTLVLALVLGGLGALTLSRRTGTGPVIGALVCAVLVGAIAVYDIADVSRLSSEASGPARAAPPGLGRGSAFDVDASVGIGLWVVLLGAVVASAGCALALRGRARA